MNTKAPSVADEMAKFSGYTTNNGETVPAAKTVTSPGTTDLADDERAAGIKVAGGEARAKGATTTEKPAAKVELTDAEAETALEKATAELGEGESLTVEEETEVLTKALTEKRAKAKGPAAADPNSRVKRAQDGRRRAEARAARAETKLSELERRLAAVEGGGTAPLTGGTKVDNDAVKEPDPTKFELGELDPKYIRALVRWENSQADADRAKNQQTTRQTAEQQAAAAEVAEKKAAFEEAGLDDYDDFQEVVMDTVNLPKSDPAAWPLSATVGRLLLDSDQGQHIAYMLASDPKEAKRVDKLTAAEQMRWFFQQEAKFSAENPAANEDGDAEVTDETTPKTPAPRQVTKAPAPPNRNRGGTGTRQPSAATTDFAAFEAMAGNAAKPKR